MKKLLLALALLVAAYQTYENQQLFSHSSTQRDEPTGAVQDTSRGNAILAEAFRNRRSNVQVQASGTVMRLLPDDTEGSPHQRFILRTSADQTVLIAHNIELAPRIEDLRAGEAVEFYGEYEWNERGGLVHWTHDDPKGQHPAGWIRYRGQRYQ